MASPGSSIRPMRRRRQKAPLAPTKFVKFSSSELMDVVETSLMNAQIHYDALRHAPPSKAPEHLHEVHLYLQQALLGTEEMQARAE